jgi:RNA polymerase sigma factor (sigma-70 family)
MVVQATASPILQLIRRTVEDVRVRELPDQDLVQRFHTQQDQAAFHAMLRRHGPMVLDVCRGVLGNEADAEDAFQATFLILARKAGSIRKTASVASWLHGVAYRIALKARGQSAARQKHEARVPARQPSEPDDLSWPEVRQVLHEEVSRLSERFRAPLVLCYLEGATQEAAARQLNLAKSTLQERLERGRALLRTRLLRRGLGPAALLIAAAWPAANTFGSAPISLMVSTAKAVSLIAAGQVAAGTISTKVAALTEEILKSMLLSKLKLASAVLLAATLLGIAGGAALIHCTQAAEPLAAKQGASKDPSEPEVSADPRNSPPAPTIVHGDGRVVSLALSPDGKTMATVTADLEMVGVRWKYTGSRLTLWDLPTRKTKKVLSESEKEENFVFNEAAFSPDGKTLAVSADGIRNGALTVSGEMQLWDVETGQLKRTLEGRFHTRSPCFSPDSKTLAGRSDDMLKLWDVESGEEKRSLQMPGTSVWQVTFSPDGKLVLAGSHAHQPGDKSKVMMWDVATGEIKLDLNCEGEAPEGYMSVTFAGNGALVAAAGGRPGKVWLWEMRTGKLKHTLEGSDKGVLRVGSSPNGKTLAVVCADHTVKLWDLTTEKWCGTLQGHEAKIWSAAFSPDGRTLLSGSEDKTVRVWRLDQRPQGKRQEEQP